MKISDRVITDLKRVLELVSQDNSEGWLLTAAMALKALASDIREEVEAAKIREVVASTPPEPPDDKETGPDRRA